MMNPKVNFYFEKAKTWQEEIVKLRSIVLEIELTEELKWGVPCYTFQKNNLLLIHVFKEYCAVLFFKGALLSDSSGLLIQQTENVQAARQMRFTSMQDIIEKEVELKAYIYEAMEVEKAGLKVALKPATEFKTPEELQAKFDKNPLFKAAFEALTPGRQRGYKLHFAEPKQAKTRETRVEKWMPQIMKGKGLNDFN
jgi:uncharacterized protein YdeI (YjbR/CyaY-like superfamily)